MSLPYQNATSGEKSITEMQKILRHFGCSKFGHMLDYENGTLMVQFTYREKMIHIEASSKGYAAAWLKENPWNSRRKCSSHDHEQKALDIASVAIYSVLRD